jgi:hypothetical protein
VVTQVIAKDYGTQQLLAQATFAPHHGRAVGTTQQPRLARLAGLKVIYFIGMPKRPVRQCRLHT